MDIFWDDQGDQILGIVDKGTGFHAARVLNRLTTAHLRLESVRSWGVEPVSAAGGARYQVGFVGPHHCVLNEVFSALRTEHPRENKSVVLQFSVHAKNQLGSYRGLPPCVRVFGQMPRVPDVLTGKFPQLIQDTSYESGTEAYSTYTTHTIDSL